MKATVSILTLAVSATPPNDICTPASIDLSAADGQVWLQAIGAMSGTHVLETSVDGVTWVAAAKQFFKVADLTAFTSITAAGMAQTIPGVGGSVALFRLRCTGYVSGTPTVQVIWRDTRQP